MTQDLCIVRYKNGITLLKPELCTLQAPSRVMLSDIDKLAIDIYFYNMDNTFGTVNEATARSCGFDSPTQASGSKLHNTAIGEYAEQLIRNNELVLKKNMRNFLYEEIKCHDGTYNRGVSFKMPWYKNGNITGIFGCTIVDGKHVLVDSLNHILDLGFLEKNTNLLDVMQTRTINGVAITQREANIVCLIAKGKTAMQVGHALNLSRRTVENYISNIKDKIGVKSKSELIDLYIEQL